MSRLDKQRLFIKFLTLVVLVICLSFLSYGENFVVFTTELQTKTPTMSVQSSSDTPLLISSLRFDPSEPRAPEITFEITNVSSNPIRAYAIREVTTKDTLKGESGSAMIADMDSTNAILQPGQTITDSIIHQALSKETSDIKIIVDFIEFTDGTTWGPDLYKSAERLAGRRAGVSEANKRLYKILETKGVQAVMNAIDTGVLNFEPSTSHSSIWEESFRSGLNATSTRLKRALDKGGLTQVELELRQLFAKSERR
ncbi:MAG: motile sperm domain-containing protein [Acidobacteriota bacterium]|nr:motile sperm domain-containing protein [Acidobacteriota bacterium]